MCLAIPGKLVALSGEDPLTRTGTVDFNGARREISLALTPEAATGDHVLVHVGVAIQIVDPEEASKTWEILRQLEAPGELVPP